MTQDGDRIDRIEAALDRQVAVNADLRTSIESLKLTADALLQVATIHQQNFERLTSELNADRQQWKAQIQQVQERVERDRQDWQSQIERLWQHLQQRGNG